MLFIFPSETDQSDSLQMMLHFRPFDVPVLATKSYTWEWNQLQTIQKATQETCEP